MRYFGDNGAILDELSDNALERELASKLRQNAAIPCAGFTSLSATYTWIAFEDRTLSTSVLFNSLVLLVALLLVLPAIMSFMNAASEAGHFRPTAG